MSESFIRVAVQFALYIYIYIKKQIELTVGCYAWLGDMTDMASTLFPKNGSFCLFAFLCVCFLTSFTSLDKNDFLVV